MSDETQGRDRRHFRLLNVFTIAGDRFSGNPLCVFENGDGLSAEQMQKLARQFNLSETTFILPASQPGAAARVRIFTPTFEMPFAGHPTLGTAQVVRALGGAGKMTLEMKAGMVEVRADGNHWTLRTAKPPATRAPKASSAELAELAEMLGVSPAAVGKPLWVDTGAEQLVIPLRNASEVQGAKPVPALLAKLGYSETRGESMAYIWGPGASGEILARFFFLQNGSLVEDPATGSACANLGGYLLTTGHELPVQWKVQQGAQVGRPSTLQLTVERAGAVFVGGEVVEMGRGTLDL